MKKTYSKEWRQVAVRYTKEELEMIDAVVESMRASPVYAGMRVTRTTVIRMAVLFGLVPMRRILESLTSSDEALKPQGG
jgi:hypothetical protein